jgi:hypothetical protein
MNPVHYLPYIAAILTAFSYIRVRLNLQVVSPFNSPTKILYSPFSSPTRDTCPAHLTPLDLTALGTRGGKHEL